MAPAHHSEIELTGCELPSHHGPLLHGIGPVYLASSMTLKSLEPPSCQSGEYCTYGPDEETYPDSVRSVCRMVLRRISLFRKLRALTRFQQSEHDPGDARANKLRQRCVQVHYAEILPRALSRGTRGFFETMIEVELHGRFKLDGVASEVSV